MECTCEKVTWHYLGPGNGYGPVLDQETVIHAVFELSEVEEGKLKPAAFAIKQLTKPNFSVARTEHIDCSNFLDHVVKPLIEKNGEFVGVASASVTALRQILVSYLKDNIVVQGRAVCVLDFVTLGEHDSHAALGFSEGHADLDSKTKQKIRPFIQNDLAKTFNVVAPLKLYLKQ